MQDISSYFILFILSIFLIPKIHGNNNTLNEDTLYLKETPTPSARQIFDMSLEELLQLKVITPSKEQEKIKEAPAIISVITERDIKQYAFKNLGDILDMATSTFIYGSFYLPNNMITIRGEVTSHYCTHVLLLLNGRPVRSSKEGYYLPILRSFPISSIKQIEILRGPGSALYGSNAYAGVINIITKEGSQQETSAIINYGSFGTSTAQIATGFAKNDLNISIGGFYQNSEGWDYEIRGASGDSLYPKTITPAIESSKGISLNSSYKEIMLNAYLGSNYQMIGQQSQKWWYADEWYLGTTKALVDLGYTHDFNNKLSSKINITYNYLYYWQPYDIHANDYREWGYCNDYIIEMIHFYSPNPTIKLKLGGLTNTQTGVIQNTETLSDGTPYNVWENPENPDPYYVVPKYNETWWSTYGTMNYSPIQQLHITLGAHANKTSNLDLHIVPRLGIVCTPLEFLSIKLLYGQAFRSPDYFELYSKVNGIYGNKYLNPEKIKTYETQLVLSRKKYEIAISYFNNSQTDIIGRSLSSDSLVVIDGVSQPTFINSEGLKSQGIEIESKFSISSNCNALFSTLYHENEDLSGQENIYGLPNLFIKGGLSYMIKKCLQIGVYNMWVSKGNEFDVKFPNASPKAASFDYLSIKLNADINELFDLRLKNKIQIELNGYNILNEKIYYPEYGYKNINSIPGRPGIAFDAGLKIAF